MKEKFAKAVLIGIFVSFSGLLFFSLYNNLSPGGYAQSTPQYHERLPADHAPQK